MQRNVPEAPQHVIPSIHIRYDMLGRKSSIRSSEDGPAMARFMYDGVGRLSDEFLQADSAGAPVHRRAEYDELGRCVSLGDELSTHTYSYRKGGGKTGPYLDGSATSETTAFASSRFTGAEKPTDFRYDIAKDRLGRLGSAIATDANGKTRDEWSIGLDRIDADSSLMSFQKGGVNTRLPRQQGSHRIAVVEQDTATAALHYWPDGSLRAMKDARTGEETSFQYGEILSQTREVRLPGILGRMEFSHTADGDQACRSELSTEGVVSQRVRIGPGTQPLLEITRRGDGTVSVLQYIWGVRGPMLAHLDGRSLLLLQDRGGSTRVAVDAATGIPAGWFNYVPFGTLQDDNTGGEVGVLSAINRRYMGCEWDETISLYNLNARLYNPSWGTFLSVDQALEMPDGYCYVNNDPTELSDPTGLSSEEVIGTAEHAITRNYRSLGLRFSTDAKEEKFQIFAAKRLYAQVENSSSTTMLANWDLKHMGYLQNMRLMYRHPGLWVNTDFGRSMVTRTLKGVVRSMYSIGLGYAYGRELGMNARRAVGTAFLVGGINELLGNFFPDMLYQKYRVGIGRGAWGCVAKSSAHMRVNCAFFPAFGPWCLAQGPFIFGEAFARTAVLNAMAGKDITLKKMCYAAVLGAANFGLSMVVSFVRAHIKVGNSLTNKGARQQEVTSTHPTHQEAMESVMGNAWTNPARRAVLKRKMALRIGAEAFNLAGKAVIDSLYLTLYLRKQD